MDRLFRPLNRIRRGAHPGAPFFPLVVVLAFACAASSGCASPEAAPGLSHTFKSPEDLAAAVVDGLERKDLDGLASLALSEAEFKSYVWPELPASRPERHVPFGFVWSQLHGKSHAYLRATVAQYGGQPLDVLQVRFKGETTDYDSFSVSRDAEVVVRDAAGQEKTVRLFGSVLHQGDRYKLFSYVVD
jgi:hypothetical protein